MAQQFKVGTVATTIYTDDCDKTHVIYRGTPVVTFTHNKVVLQTRGWFTQTTKTRMNQASNQFHLGFRVFQKGFEWFVTTPNGYTIPYAEGMLFFRN
jgi:hypothetical protein